MLRSLITLLLLIPSLGHAETTLGQPTGEVLLEVFGNISVTNASGTAQFDRKMIKALPQFTINTSNHVVSEVAEYRGPRLYDLLSSLGAKGETVNVIAWDDYVATLQVSELKQYQVLLATHENGREMTLDDRGPFFVVFPFTDHKELRKDKYYSMSVWQIKEIEVN